MNKICHKCKKEYQSDTFASRRCQECKIQDIPAHQKEYYEKNKAYILNRKKKKYGPLKDPYLVHPNAKRNIGYLKLTQQQWLEREVSCGLRKVKKEKVLHIIPHRTPERVRTVISLPKLCSVKGCYAKHHSKGLCHKHYADPYRYSYQIHIDQKAQNDSTRKLP